MIIIERYYSEKCPFMGFGKHIGGKKNEKNVSTEKKTT